LIGAGAPLVDAALPDPVPGPGEVVVGVAAAGVCRSDVHYRAGDPRLPPVPRVLGHEVAGYIEDVGDGVVMQPGTPVALHYQVGCGACAACRRDDDRFCPTGAMIGNQRDGGYAERILVPERNAVPVPDGIDLGHAAVMMCSSVTSLHALHQARFQPGERVGVFGAGGLGMSAIQLARALGAATVYAVDVDESRLAVARTLGATPVDAREDDPVAFLQARGGVDVALELIGLARTTRQAVRSLRLRGRAAIAGLTGEVTEIGVYEDLMAREAELIGVMDHTLAEVHEVVAHAARGELDLGSVVTNTIPLDAAAVNRTLDALEGFGPGIRTVIVP
jgi:propanol-preferring alcohol dehydrogenase